MSDGDCVFPVDLPAHLRDDAPTNVCDRCGRRTADAEQFGAEDRMTQPDGNPCGGRFVDAIRRGDPEITVWQLGWDEGYRAGRQDQREEAR